MRIILGIDPGSRLTGFGIIRFDGKQSTYLHSGCLRLTDEQSYLRLHHIFLEIQKLVLHYKPIEAAIEQVFMHKNANSALKLGQARGAAIAALGQNLKLFEYSARQIKQSVVGFGAAKKEQVQHMVQRLLNIKTTLQADEADALAIALCHAHSNNLMLQSKSTSRRSTSWRKLNLSQLNLKK